MQNPNALVSLPRHFVAMVNAQESSVDFLTGMPITWSPSIQRLQQRGSRLD